MNAASNEKEIVFCWNRFVASRGAPISYDENGFLIDNRFRWDGRASRVTSFTELDAIPAVVLLGEPGIGKSHTLLAEFNRTATDKVSNGSAALWFDLSLYSSDTRLVADIFNNEVFVARKRAKAELFLFLDSLDECQLAVKNVARLLGEEFRARHWPSLRLRISCRSAIWPGALEQTMSQIWEGERAIRIVELQPLRREDVESAAVRADIDAKIFLSAIESSKVGSFAARPITLLFLINLFRRTQSLPGRRRDLYAQGLKTLVDELSSARRAAGHTGTLTVQARLAIAGVISAISVFCNRAQIWIGPDSQCPEECLSSDQLADAIRDLRLQVNGDLRLVISEVLNTALYVGRGENRVAAAHESYREYLASRFIVEHPLANKQLEALITNANDPEQSVAPQLFGTVAWLYEMSPYVRDYVNWHQPELILQSDIDLDVGVAREPLIEAIMGLVGQGKFFDLNFSTQKRMRKLACPGLYTIIGPYIRNKEFDRIGRQAAIAIVEACGDKRALPDLADVVSDSADIPEIRQQAASALVELGSSGDFDCLRAFLVDDNQDDIPDDLIAVALDALWPSELSTARMLECLRSPRQNHYVGRYSMFLNTRLLREIDSLELLPALKWVQENAREQPDYDLDPVQQAILMRAFKEVSRPEVRAVLASVVWRHMLVFSQIFDRSPTRGDAWEFESSDDRRALLLEVASLVDDTSMGAALIATSRLRIVRDEDLKYLLAQYSSLPAGLLRETIKQLLVRIVNCHPIRSHYDAILERCGFEVPNRDDELAKLFGWIVEPMILGSPEAESARDSFRQRMDREKRRNTPEKIDPPPKVRIEMALAKVESGATEWWVPLVAELSLEETSLIYNHFGINVFEQPGWRDADERTRDRIARAGLRYLETYVPPPELAEVRNQWNTGQEAPMVALAVLEGYAPDLYAALTQENWARLFASILCIPWANDDERLVRWLRRAFESNKSSGVALVAARLQSSVEHPMVQSTLDKVVFLWCPEIYQSVGIVLRHKQTTGEGYVALLKRTLAQERSSGIALALELLTDPSREDLMPQTFSMLLGRALGSEWDALWPRFRADDSLATAAMLEINPSDESMEKQLSELPPDRLGQFYARLEHLFPGSSDPVPEGLVTSRRKVGLIRDLALNTLQRHGTFEAVQELTRLSLEFPELLDVKFALANATQAARAASWNTPSIEGFVGLLSDPNKRFVRSAQELASTILESLDALQRHVQGPNKPATQYWDERPNDQRPKSETRLADYLGAFLNLTLRKSGIVLSREVEIRNIPGQGVGERTDLLVSATSKESSISALDVVEVVIECKGCWNGGLYEDMRGQLRDRYMHEGGFTSGIYVVGWYLCAVWNANDPRLEQARRLIGGLSLDHLRARLAEDARSLSVDSKVASYVLDLSLGT